MKRWRYIDFKASSALATTALIGTMVAVTPTWAQSTNLGSMVISANRTATPITQVGSSVTVVTAEDIAKKQAVTAMDVIEESAGLNIAANGGMGKASYIFMRGVGYKNILILIDGVEVADPSGSQSTYDLTHLQADNIERIEILRGNQSTLYGSDAIGGVISITTKSGRGVGKVISGSAGAEYGTYNTRKGYVNAQGEFNNIYYSAGLSALNTDGFDISNVVPGTENDGYANRSADLQIGSDILKDIGILDRLNVEGLARMMRGDTDYDGSATQDGDKQIRNLQRSGKLSVTADMFDGILSNNFTASQAYTRRDYYENKQRNTAQPYYDGEKTKYEYLGTIKPIEDHTMVVGLDREREHMKTYNISPESVTNTGVFGNYQLELLDDTLTLTAGVRQDDHETFGDKTTYRGTIGYRLIPTNTRFHASYGTGFRAPSLFELYSKYGLSTLEPEESTGYDIGFEQSFMDGRLVFDSTFFSTRLNNEIGYSSSAKKYYNIASSRTFGVENTATFDVSPEWHLSGSYTYQQGRDNQTGKVLPTRPHHVAHLRASYSPEEIAGLDTWVSGRFATWSYDAYASSPFTGGYAVFDLGASYDITDWATVYGRVENLADKRWYTKGEYAETGRAGYVGMRLKF